MLRLRSQSAISFPDLLAESPHRALPCDTVDAGHNSLTCAIVLPRPLPLWVMNGTSVLPERLYIDLLYQVDVVTLSLSWSLDLRIWALHLCWMDIPFYIGWALSKVAFKFSAKLRWAFIANFYCG